MPASLFEDTFVHRCCDGDRNGYRELYDHYSGGLLAIAMRYMKRKQEAEDVLQDSFIRVIKNLASFDKKASLSTWMTRIVNLDVSYSLNSQYAVAFETGFRKGITAIDQTKDFYPSSFTAGLVLFYKIH